MLNKITSNLTLLKHTIIASGILALIVLTMVLVACANSALTPATQQPGQAQQLPPVALKIDGLVIKPAEANPDEKIVITAWVTNTGGLDGSYNADLKINDTPEKTTAVIVPAGTSQAVIFQVSKNKPGDYSVTLGELTGRFVIKPATVIQPNDFKNTAPPSTKPSCCQ